MREIKRNRLVNDEALADPIYNPAIDKKTIQLYNLMAPTAERPDPPAVVQEYREQFLAFTTENIYSTVLVNPVQCELDDIEDLLDVIDGHIGIITPNVPPGSQPGWTDIRDNIGGIRTDLVIIRDHTNRLTSNLPSLVGIAQTIMGIATIVAALANPCAGLGNFFGSIMEDGKKLLNDIRTALAPVAAKMAELANAAAGAYAAGIAEINTAMAPALAAIDSFMAKVDSEIAAFTQALMGQERMGLADFMNSSGSDPCVKALTGSAMSAAAAAILK